MHIVCPHCTTSYAIKLASLGANGRTVRCSRCKETWVARPEDAVAGLDIVITATSAREPVLQGEWLSEGTHLNVIGSNYLSKAEVDVQTIRRANRIVVEIGSGLGTTAASATQSCSISALSSSNGLKR